MLTLRSVTDPAALAALEPCWNPLLQRSQSDSFFLTWEWIATWWQVYGSGYQLLLLLAQDAGGEVVGIAPLMVARERRPLGRRRLMFLGQDSDVTPEYLDFLIAPGSEAAVLELFAEALATRHRRCWDVIYLQRVLEGAANLAALSGALQRRGITLASHNRVICRFAVLGGDWDGYLGAKSSHFRKRWNYTERRLSGEGELNCQFVPEEVSLEKAYDELVQLNRERWGEQGASFRSAAYIDFHRRLCRRIAPRGWLLLALLTLDGRTIAAKYDYLYAGKVWGNQGGWSEEYRNKNVGEVMIGMLLKWSMARGIAEYDFLGGEAPYKERWGTGERMTSDWTGYNATLSGRAWRCAAGARGWLKRTLPEPLLARVRALRKGGAHGSD